MFEERVKELQNGFNVCEFSDLDKKVEIIPEYKWVFKEKDMTPLKEKNGVDQVKRKKIREIFAKLYKKLIPSNSLLAYEIANEEEENFFNKTETDFI